jgi:hypothetical protein
MKWLTSIFNRRTDEMPTTTTKEKETCEATATVCRNQPKGKSQLSATCETGETTTEGQCPAQVCCEKVRERAYYKWEQAGYPSGDGVNFWLEAESELQAETAETE